MTERDELDEEREFQDFLKRRRSPFPTEPAGMEPPEALDRWVLQRARDGIRISEQPRLLRTNSWAVPFATAATVVIAIGLFFNADRMPSGSPSSDVTAIPAARETNVPVADAVAPTDSAVTVDLQSDRSAESDAAEIATDPAREPPARVEEQRDTSASPPSARVIQEKEDRAQFTPPPALPRAVAAPAPTVVNAAPTADVGGASSAAVVASVETEEVARRDNGFAAAADSTNSPRIEPRDTQSLRIEAGAVAKSVEYRRDADSWWAEIERLRVAGDVANMERELVDFRKAYPNDERGILAPAKP